MIHNFDLSQQHERDQAEKADTFYRTELFATEIRRFNTDSIADMEMQRQDVDVMITLSSGLTYKISEKFRDKDYGDLYVEVFSKYPSTPGWLETGSPNAVLYFTPSSVYWITHKSLASFCLNVLFPSIPHTWYSELFESHQTITSKYIKIKGELVKINLIQAHNFLPDGTKWETIGISIPFSILQKNGVKIMSWNF